MVLALFPSSVSLSEPDSSAEKAMRSLPSAASNCNADFATVGYDAAISGISSLL